MNKPDDTKVLSVVAFTGLMFLIVMMPTIVISFFVGTEMQGLVGTALFFLNFGLYYFLVYAFIRWEGGSSISEVGADVEDKQLFSHISIGLLAGAIGAGIVVFIAGFFGGDLRPGSQITIDLILSEIIITVPTAFFEELAFRGYMVPRMASLWGKGKGIVIGSLVFGLSHFSWWAPLGSVPIHLVLLFTFNLTLGGIILSLSYFMSGDKLWVPIGFHFAWNMIAYIMFPVYPRDYVYLPEIFQIEWGATTFIGFLLGLSVVWLLIDMLKKKK
ncbi:MAG: type II CAAX endopeptidase family protein [Candidatus Thorarchaeota archaeon]|nr:type II CAAX endopeptidase family protein [Candidatus Thorarchaeota archaeon]